MFKLKIFTVFGALGVLQAARLPSYLTPCKINDPDLSACIKRSANMNIRDIVKGDYHYDIAPANPLRIPGPIVLKDNNQEIIVTNLEIHGLEHAEASDVEFHLDEGVVKLVLEIPSTTAYANCQSTGNYFGYHVPHTEFLHEKLDGVTLTHITNFTRSTTKGRLYFTDLSHSEELKVKQQYNRFLPITSYAFVPVQKTICQEKFPKIIEKQIGEHIQAIYMAIIDRVPVEDVLLS